MKTAIVTGGAQGIGRVSTQYLLTHGYRVAVWGADPDALADLPKIIDTVVSTPLMIVCDVLAEEAVRRAV